jgi:AP-1 complex subunit gamma-1
VSERKPVGTTRTDKDTVVDLIGDDLSAPTPQAASSGPSTQDLLADIFGSSSMDTVASAPTPGAPSRSANDDIMSLFGGSSSTASAASPPPAAAPANNSLFDLVSPSASTAAPVPAQQAHQAPPPAAAKAQLQSYPAYDKHGLKITLTPRVSPTQPGVVQILARFTASESVETVNLQVAVPKVSVW